MSRVTCPVSLLFVALLLLILMQVSSILGDERVSAPTRLEKDSAGHHWVLSEWADQSRPYAKGLLDRETSYRQKWGESWRGPKNGRRIHSPGDWQREAVTTAPDDLAGKIRSKKLHSGKPRAWGDGFWGKMFVWAQNGGVVTDLYALADNGFYHYAPHSGQHSFIGNPEERGLRDGAMDQARLNPGGNITLDSITGRLYFIQGNTLRYVEKLLPYTCTVTGTHVYLPAVLDRDDLYRQLTSSVGRALQPLRESDRRAAPRFVVRSNPFFKTPFLPGAASGKRPLITPDGKGVYFSQVPARGREWDTLTLYETTALFDIETGRLIEKLVLAGTVPRNYASGTDGPGSHGANNSGFDGRIYTSQHGGSGGGPGRMFSVHPGIEWVTG